MQLIGGGYICIGCLAKAQATSAEAYAPASILHYRQATEPRPRRTKPVQNRYKKRQIGPGGQDHKWIESVSN